MHAFQPLGRSFRVIALDQRGHGGGVRAPALRGFRLEDCADDVVALADVLGIDRFIPVGYSMGGPVAQLTWRRHPDRVDGLVLCATSRNFRGTPSAELSHVALSGTSAALAAALRAFPPVVRQRAASAGLVWRKRALGLPEWALEELAKSDPPELVEGLRALQSFNSAPWIGSVDVPTAVVVTEGDHIVPPGRQHKLAASIPGAREFPVPGDHDVCVADPGVFVPAVVAACRWVSSRVPAGA
jgi:3-oxoadipate enol-lactonase